MSANVVIIDYRLCNLDSIRRAIEECGGRPLVTRDPRDLAGADRIVLPGVGSFTAAMANLTSDGFAGALPDIVLGKKVPILGVCLGMHLLGRQGTEHGETPGLGLLSGVQRRLVGATPTERVPHTGWNDVSIKRPVPLFDGIPSGADFYFVHSYHLASDNEEIVATVDAGGGVVAAAAADHVMAVQFHPEKSQASGFRLLRNFLAY